MTILNASLFNGAKDNRPKLMVGTWEDYLLKFRQDHFPDPD